MGIIVKHERSLRHSDQFKPPGRSFKRFKRFFNDAVTDSEFKRRQPGQRGVKLIMLSDRLKIEFQNVAFADEPNPAFCFFNGFFHALVISRGNQKSVFGNQGGESSERALIILKI